MAIKTDSAISENITLNTDAAPSAEELCVPGSDNGAMVTFDSGSYTLAVAVTPRPPRPPRPDDAEWSNPDDVDNTTSAVVPGSLPPSILLTGAAKGLAATNSILGCKMWAPELQVLGFPFNLSAVSLPPWPLIITRGTQIDQWAASFEVIETIGVGVPGIADLIAMLRASTNPAAPALAALLSLLGPLGSLTEALILSVTNILGNVLTAPTIHAQLIHAKPTVSSMDALFQTNWTVVDDINLGEIPLISVFSTFHGEHKLTQPYPIAPGDYLLVRYYLDTNLAAEAFGFHAGANVVIS